MCYLKKNLKLTYFVKFCFNLQFNYNFYYRCDVEIYPKAFPITRDELLKRVRGKDGLYCMVTEKIDNEVLDAAGNNKNVF